MGKITLFHRITALVYSSYPEHWLVPPEKPPLLHPHPVVLKIKIRQKKALFCKPIEGCQDIPREGRGLSGGRGKKEGPEQEYWKGQYIYIYISGALR